MALKKSAKRILAALSAAICAVCVSCGPDLGNVEDESDYASKFPSVKFVGSDLNVSEKTIGDLYNDNAVNNFNRKDFVCPTESDAYKYMAVFAGEDLSVEEFAVYLRSGTDVTLNVCVYGADGLPSVIAKGDEDDFETVTESGESTSAEEKKKPKKFDEPVRENAAAEVTVSLKANEWKSFSVKTWKKDGGKEASIRLEKGGCLLFQFCNNCVVYDNEDKIIRNDNPAVEICFTAMLIRVG